MAGVFDGIDFTDIRVLALFGVMMLLLFLIISGIFVLFGWFIPKSKMQDIETITAAIHRLEKWMRFDKIALTVSAAGLIIMAVMHFATDIDIFQSPFSWVVLIDAAVFPIFLTAVFGMRGDISPNQRKLDDLQRRKAEIQSKRPGK